MSSDTARSELVVLIPGLWMPAWVMLPMAWRLRATGLRCVLFGYASARASLDENADRLAGFLRALGECPVHLVGHSLGGVLALHTTLHRRPARVRSVVMMGSPAGGSFAAHRLLEKSWGRRIVGRTVPDWLQQPGPAVPADVSVGVIAGNRALGLGMIVAPDMPRPHDGVVRVAETAVSGAADSVELAVSHAAMLVSARVARLVAAFVRSGRFEPAAERGRTRSAPAIAIRDQKGRSG